MRRAGDEVELLGSDLKTCKKKIVSRGINRGTIAKNIERTTRQQLDGQQMPFVEYLRSWPTLNIS